MRTRLLAAMALTVILAPDGGAQTVALICPSGSSSAAGGSCRMRHYHVAMWRPDTKGFEEIFGQNSFASLPACEKAMELETKENQAAIAALLTADKDAKVATNRYGPCHCDMTLDRSNPNFLTDDHRDQKRRAAAEIVLKLRDRLLSAEVNSGSDLVRALWTSSNDYRSPITESRLTPLPKGSMAETPRYSAADLKDTQTSSTSQRSAPAVKFSLVDVPGTLGVAPPETNGSMPGIPSLPAAPPSAGEMPASPANSSPSVSAPSPPEETTAGEEEGGEDDGTTDRFIAFETARVQEFLRAGGAIHDDAIKSKIFEASMQRLQLLSNLRSVIDSGGSRSRLAMLARGAKGPDGRLRFVERVFGSEIRSHWAPQDAKEIILAPRPEVDSDPIAVLRDATGRFSDVQRRYALYMLLARSQELSEAQKAWLAELLEASISQSQEGSR